MTQRTATETPQQTHERQERERLERVYQRQDEGNERKRKADEARQRRARIEEALAFRPEDHQWLNDLDKARAHYDKTRQATGAAAKRVKTISDEREATKQRRDELANKRTALEKEAATLQAAVNVGEGASDEEARLAAMRKTLAKDDTQERVGLHHLEAALEEREAAALRDYAPLHVDRLAAEENLTALQLAELQAQIASLEAQLVPLTTKARHLVQDTRQAPQLLRDVRPNLADKAPLHALRRTAIQEVETDE